MDLHPVIWSEGLLLTPQHFQQQERYLLRTCASRYESYNKYAAGFSELKIDAQLLRQGKIALLNARGVLPDFTPFDMPAAHELPTPVNAGADSRNCLVYLALPLNRSVAGYNKPGELVRLDSRTMEICDAHLQDALIQNIDVGNPNFRILVGTAELHGFSCLPFAYIRDVREDGSLLLDEEYIPPSLSFQVAVPLSRFMAELCELLRQQASAIAARLCGNGSCEPNDILLLCTLNRSATLASHFAQSSLVHPYDLFLHLIQLTAELATFRQKDMLSPSMPCYHHLDPRRSFEPLRAMLREFLQRSIERAAKPIPLSIKSHGIRIAALDDFSLADDVRLILSVNAELGIDQIRSQFPAAAKLAPASRIRQLVNLQLPGMRLIPLNVPPRQINFDGACSYFELERDTQLWPELKACRSLALHIADGLPGLTTMLWMLCT